MGNAFIALSDDGTAASWNPAGLSQLRKPEFSLVYNTSHRSVSLEGYRTRDESAAFTTLSTATTVATLEFASAAVPFSAWGRAVTLQVGWRRLYEITSGTQGDMRRVPVTTASRPGSVIRIDDSSDGNIDLWSLAGAVRFTSRLSLGWSVDLYRGEWEDRQNASEDPGVLGPTDFSSTDRHQPGHRQQPESRAPARLPVVPGGSRASRGVPERLRVTNSGAVEPDRADRRELRLRRPDPLSPLDRAGCGLAPAAPSPIGPGRHLRRVDGVPARGDAGFSGSSGERLRRAASRAERHPRHVHRERGAGEAHPREGRDTSRCAWVSPASPREVGTPCCGKGSTTGFSPPAPG